MEAGSVRVDQPEARTIVCLGGEKVAEFSVVEFRALSHDAAMLPADTVHPPGDRNHRANDRVSGGPSGAIPLLRPDLFFFPAVEESIGIRLIEDDPVEALALVGGRTGLEQGVEQFFAGRADQHAIEPEHKAASEDARTPE
jgi:hypothetical protein